MTGPELVQNIVAGLTMALPVLVSGGVPAIRLLRGVNRLAPHVETIARGMESGARIIIEPPAFMAPAELHEGPSA